MIFFWLFSLIFNNKNIFLNWINVGLSKQSYSSIAFCLCLETTNLFTVPVPSFLIENLDIRDNKSFFIDGLESPANILSSFPSFWLSSSWLFSKSCIPFIAPFLSTLLSILYFCKQVHNVSFSSSEFHTSYKSIAFKKSSNWSKDNNSLLFEVKKFSIFLFNSSSNKSGLMSSGCTSSNTPLFSSSFTSDII